MYKVVEKADVLAELNNGSVMYVVDVPTLRIMECANLTLSAVKSFIDKAEALFLKEVASE